MQNAAIELFYLFFQGIISFQVLIFAALYLITKRLDLLYYCLFLFFAAAYFFINAPYTFFGIPEEVVWKSAWYGYINTPVIIVENVFYLLFLQAFFADITMDRNVAKVFRYILGVVPLIVVLFIMLTFLKMNKQFIFYTVKLLTIFPAIAVIGMVLKKRLPFYSLVAKGLLCTIIGTCLTVLMIVLGNNNVHHLFTVGYPLFFIRLGLLGDMIFYFAAILKKWHFQEKQLAVEKVNSELAVEQVRNRISGELHDDLGSTLSGISMYSYIVNDLLQKGQYEKAKQSVGIIQKTANAMVDNLSDLVWTINPKLDSFETLLDRLGQYGEEICVPKEISFKLLFENLNLNGLLSMHHRHHIYLFLKEAINNSAKHSGATCIEVSIRQVDNCIHFSVNDDGKGFGIDEVRAGNGLINMRKRAEEIGAVFTLETSNGMGCRVSIYYRIS